MHLPTILIVDDDRDCIRTLSRLLRPQYRVVETTSAEAALELLLHGKHFDAVICDMCMEGWSGRELYARLERHDNPHISRFVMLTGEDIDQQRPAFAQALGERLLRKPVDPTLLRAVLSTLIVGAKESPAPASTARGALISSAPLRHS